nr:retrovirus-related Pol polyprotein from transposon TNT 1-94 [Tanacetum cinerariifolium]
MTPKLSRNAPSLPKNPETLPKVTGSEKGVPLGVPNGTMISLPIIMHNDVITIKPAYDPTVPLIPVIFPPIVTERKGDKETSSSEYKSWMRCDAMIKWWLTTTIEKGIRDSMKYSNTSSEIWSDLKERFGKESAPRAYELKKKITATRQEGSRVLTYYTHLSYKREGCFKLVGYPDWWPGKKDDKAKPKAAYVETGTSPIPGLNEGRYQEFVKFFSRSSNNVEAKPEANMAVNKDDVWVVDSGCTEICKDLQCAVTFFPNFFVMQGLRTRSLIGSGSLDCNKDEPTKVHDDFKSTNFFLDSGEQSCFDGPPQNPSSTTTEDIGSEEENVAQHENDLFVNNSAVLGPKIKDHAISHKEPKLRTFLTTISSNHEPSCFEQATQDEKWRNAMQQEIKALEKNGTWTLEELPEGKRPIDSKWVCKTKFKSNGEVERYKARLVAKGCTQREGVDYHEIFALVAKLVTIRTLLAVTTKKGWIIHQMDVNNAFLHGYLDEEVYMKIPKGFAKERETRVCFLRKSLYGLKQASKYWYKKLTSFLFSLNFEQSKADYSLFTYQKAGAYVTILIYVDDIIIVGDNSKKIQQIKQQLDNEFSIKNLGPLKYFLGITVAKTSDGKATRPDVTYAVNVLSQFVLDPRQNHLEAAKRVLRYLKGTPGQVIFFPSEGPTTLTANYDSDWLGCPFTRRSRTGYLLLFSGGPISWKTKKQSFLGLRQRQNIE